MLAMLHDPMHRCCTNYVHAGVGNSVVCKLQRMANKDRSPSQRVHSAPLLVVASRLSVVVFPHEPQPAIQAGGWLVRVDLVELDIFNGMTHRASTWHTYTHEFDARQREEGWAGSGVRSGI